MSKFKTRVFSIVLLIVLMITLIPFSVSAYSSANSIPALTGNQRNDFVHVAESQIGYREEYDNKTIFGADYGWNGVFWCAEFIWWCANKAGISTSIIPKSANSLDLIKNMTVVSNPQVGDLAANATHITIFYGDAGNGYFKGLGGNQSDSVKISTFTY